VANITQPQKLSMCKVINGHQITSPA